ncbi:extensin family protein [Qipengyuania zhejiangensis]|uniref:extensin family protein n=1 Tax=Qipengyuania zhejiangensis TaxID=3077782 RepID=UPI002D7863E6|nr:extensin family protein [Qipengyuania sp. Z2]
MRPYPAILLPILLLMAGCGAVPDSREPKRVRNEAAAATIAQTRPQTRQCHAELGQTGSRFAPLPDKYYGAGCSSLNSVRLDGIGGDESEFLVTNLGPLACPAASTLAGWARFGVDRAARQIMGSPLARIETMGSYSCRNVAGSGRLSAHARAEAIDVAAFVLADGRRISVIGGWNASKKEREFLRTVHESACKRFGTVLGPDYNVAHRDHFHLEAGNGSYCR